MSRKVMANIHSLQQKVDPETFDLGHRQAEVTILSHIRDNDVIAEYNGMRCKAIYNVFAGAYFVDDVYGIIEDSKTG